MFRHARLFVGLFQRDMIGFGQQDTLHNRKSIQPEAVSTPAGVDESVFADPLTQVQDTLAGPVVLLGVLVSGQYSFNVAGHERIDH